MSSLMACIIVAISGTPGSGKTTYAKFLAERYGLRYVSGGALFREIARERGYDLVEFHRVAEIEEDIDFLIEERSLREALKGGVVIEGHLAVWVLRSIAHAKIIFDAPLEVRARRIAVRDSKSFSEALEELVKREKSNRERAWKYYGLDVRDYSVADLVINTGLLGEESVKFILTSFFDRLRLEHPELFH
ncbi:MAG: AAA family ATPase [Thermofilum sp.]